MNVSASISSNELKRLILKAIGGSMFSQRAISEITYKLLDRIERDYPDMLKGLHQKVSKKYQNDVALRLKTQRNQNMRDIYGG